MLTWDKTQEANLGIIKEEFEKAMDAAGGEVELLEVSNEQEGKGIPGQVVSYLQRNPEVEYVAIQASEYTTGVAAAVKAAGLLEKVKIITRVPVAANVEEIKNGEMFAAVAEEDSTFGWRAINALVQRFAGKEDYEAEPVGWHQIINAENIDGFKLDAVGSPAVPGDPEQFLKAWGLESE